MKYIYNRPTHKLNVRLSINNFNNTVLWKEYNLEIKYFKDGFACRSVRIYSYTIIYIQAILYVRYKLI